MVSDSLAACAGRVNVLALSAKNAPDEETLVRHRNALVEALSGVYRAYAPKRGSREENTAGTGISQGDLFEVMVRCLGNWVPEKTPFYPYFVRSIRRFVADTYRPKERRRTAYLSFESEAYLHRHGTLRTLVGEDGQHIDPVEMVPDTSDTEYRDTGFGDVEDRVAFEQALESARLSGQRLTEKQKTALRVYLRTGLFVEAARAVGRSEVWMAQLKAKIRRCNDLVEYAQSLSQG